MLANVSVSVEGFELLVSRSSTGPVSLTATNDATGDVFLNASLLPAGPSTFLSSDVLTYHVAGTGSAFNVSVVLPSPAVLDANSTATLSNVTLYGRLIGIETVVNGAGLVVGDTQTEEVAMTGAYLRPNDTIGVSASPDCEAVLVASVPPFVNVSALDPGAYTVCYQVFGEADVWWPQLASGGVGLSLVGLTGLAPSVRLAGSPWTTHAMTGGHGLDAVTVALSTVPDCAAANLTLVTLSANNTMLNVGHRSIFCCCCGLLPTL